MLIVGHTTSGLAGGLSVLGRELGVAGEDNPLRGFVSSIDA